MNYGDAFRGTGAPIASKESEDHGARKVEEEKAHRCVATVPRRDGGTSRFLCAGVWRCGPVALVGLFGCGAGLTGD